MSPDRKLLDWRLTLNDQHLTTPMGAEVEKLGLLRGTLHIATYGAVSAKSKKQRTASMQLAAMQGKGPSCDQGCRWTQLRFRKPGELPCEAAERAEKGCQSRRPRTAKSAA